MHSATKMNLIIVAVIAGIVAAILTFPHIVKNRENKRIEKALALGLAIRNDIINYKISNNGVPPSTDNPVTCDLKAGGCPKGIYVPKIDFSEVKAATIEIAQRPSIAVTIDDYTELAVTLQDCTYEPVISVIRDAGGVSNQYKGGYMVTVSPCREAAMVAVFGQPKTESRIQRDIIETVLKNVRLTGLTVNNDTGEWDGSYYTRCTLDLCRDNY